MGKTPLALLASFTLATGVLAGCSSGSTTSAESSAAAPSTSADAASAPASASGAALASDCPLTVTDAWVKAVDTGMTGAFGVVANSSDTDVIITAANTTAAGTTELHETVDNGGGTAMQPVSQFDVPAAGTITLEPGGNHIMLMNVPAPIAPGQDVVITLTCDGGGTAEFTAQAKTYTGANETYLPEGEGSMTEPMASESAASGM